MNSLRDALADYLTVRRALGYKLARDEKLLTQFLSHLERIDASTVTIENALAWARLPATSTDGHWWSRRLTVVRGFARYLHTLDPAVEVPPPDVLPQRACRATSYLYSTGEIEALLAATAWLRTPLRRATYRTVLGLLVVTGMRVGEAIRADVDDLDVEDDLLTVRQSKLGKSRQLPLHPTTTQALRDYLRLRNGSAPTPDTRALFVSTAGTRLLYCGVHETFQRLVAMAGLRPRSASCRPRIHDTRHSFAVATVLDWYRDGGDVQARLPLLSTWLGHIHPGSTYWYLSAAPELLAMAAQRLERHDRGAAS
jgi:integrase